MSEIIPKTTSQVDFYQTKIKHKPSYSLIVLHINTLAFNSLFILYAKSNEVKSDRFDSCDRASDLVLPITSILGRWSWNTIGHQIPYAPSHHPQPPPRPTPSIPPPPHPTPNPKLCASFHSHVWIYTGVIVGTRYSGVQIGDNRIQIVNFLARLTCKFDWTDDQGK